MKAVKMKWAVIACLVGSSYGFTGFFFKDDVSGETRQFLESVKQNTKQSNKLEEFDSSELTPYVAYSYGAGSADPFETKNFVAKVMDGNLENPEDACTDDACGDGPPMPHVKYFLEGYKLEELAMIGTMADRRRGTVALIQTPNAGVIRAARGEYIGQNNGLILSIASDRMIIREKHRSTKGWQDRMAKLPLIKR